MKNTFSVVFFVFFWCLAVFAADPVPLKNLLGQYHAKVASFILSPEVAWGNHIVRSARLEIIKVGKIGKNTLEIFVLVFFLDDSGAVIEEISDDPYLAESKGIHWRVAEKYFEKSGQHPSSSQPYQVSFKKSDWQKYELYTKDLQGPPPWAIYELGFEDKTLTRCRIRDFGCEDDEDEAYLIRDVVLVDIKKII